MTNGNDDPGKVALDPATPFFSARLSPYRSLGPAGFAILMAVFGGSCFVGGLLFLAIGAWPIFCFFGLDVAILYIAFRLSYRQARAFEEVHVSTDDIHIVRVGAKGAVQEFHMNPVWARLDVRRKDDEGVVGLSLVSHGRSIDIGSFLNPPDRGSFADALAGALATARSGGPEPLPA